GDGLLALLGEGGRVEDDDAAGLAQLLPDLAGQLADQGSVVPVGLAEELLEALALAVVQVGDGLSVLAGELGEQAADVVVGMGALLAAAQGPDEGLQESLQARQQPAQQGGADLRVVEQLIQAGLKAALHGLPPRANRASGVIVRQRLALRVLHDTVKVGAKSLSPNRLRARAATVSVSGARRGG